MSYVSPTLYTGNHFSVPTSNTGTAIDTSTLPSPVTTGGLLLSANASTNPEDPISISSAGLSFLSSSRSVQDPNANFHLNVQQSQAITAILQKFVASPDTQETFNQIQDALKAAGLSADQLAAKDLQRNISPNLELVRSFTGQDTFTPGIGDEQSKAVNYLNTIYSQFRTLAANSQSTKLDTVA